MTSPLAIDNKKGWTPDDRPDIDPESIEKGEDLNIFTEGTVLPPRLDVVVCTMNKSNRHNILLNHQMSETCGKKSTSSEL